MRAAQLTAERTWQLVDVDKPDPHERLMLVRMERVAICGTDKPPYTGVTRTYPVGLGAPGHEGLGIVEDCPTGDHQPGDRVLLFGADRGLYQEYVLAPPELCIGLPKTFEPEMVLMSQLLGTVIHLFYKLGNVINKDVVVVGQGSVGLLFDATLRNLGARRIIGVDPLEYRLDTARLMGATHTINPDKQDVMSAVADITDSKMSDIAVEAVGKETTFNQCGRLLRHSGTLVYFGVPNKETPEGRMTLQFMEMFVKELNIVTSVGPKPLEDYTIALDWITQGRIDVRPLVSHILPFEEIQRGFEMAFERPADEKAIKIVLKF